MKISFKKINFRNTKVFKWFSNNKYVRKTFMLLSSATKKLSVKIPVLNVLAVILIMIIVGIVINTSTRALVNDMVKKKFPMLQQLMHKILKHI